MKEEKFKPGVSTSLNISPHNFQLWTFQHKELLSVTGNERSWDQKKLVNKLNHLNFIDGYVFIILNDNETDEYFLIKAYPQPCIKDELLCLLDSQNNFLDPNKYSFGYLMIDDGLTAILASIQLVIIEGNRLKLKLPDKSRIIATRKTRRYHCENITSEIIQDSFNARGTLIDFTPSGLGIKTTGNENIKRFDENNPVLINLYQNSSKLFSGSCRCIRNGIKSHDGKVVFEPISTQMALFPKRKIRNPRQHIAPSFSISFKHPFTQKNVKRDILEISTSGFSVQDNMEEETLIPGMIIPNISVVYARIIRMDCSVQVLYRKVTQENKIVQCGLAIVDMAITPYSYLNHILGLHLDSNARVSTEVNMDALWDFFFDSGFIYGEKYKYLQSYRETFKETYRKLYQDNTDIARHFVYEKNGVIYGHIAMVHAYEPTWIIHHFSARQLQSRVPALIVLKELTHYTNGFYRFPSSRMDYAMTYYQQENKIVDRIFGGFTRHLNNLQGSSVDLFSYILFHKSSFDQSNIHFHKSSFDQPLPYQWLLREFIPSDLTNLKEFYEEISGGLLICALGLDKSPEMLKTSFVKAGFKRDYQIFCLEHKGKQIAYFILNRSDLGLNLSDLINGIKIFVINSNELTLEVLFSAVRSLSIHYEEDNISLLIYPDKYLSDHCINVKKHYKLWILKTDDTYLEQYTEYMDTKFRMKYGNNDGRYTSI